MNISPTKLAGARGMNEKAALSIVAIFDTYEQLAGTTAEQLILIVNDLTPEAAQAAITYAQIMSKVAVTASVKMESPTAPTNPFDLLAKAGNRATQVIVNKEGVAILAADARVYAWALGEADSTLAKRMDEEGLKRVTDPLLAADLDDWKVLKDSDTAGQLIVEGHKFTVLPRAAKNPVLRRITTFWEESSLDAIMRAAAAYFIAREQAAHATATGGTYQVELKSVDSPRAVRIKLQTALKDINDLMTGGEVEARMSKLAGEMAYIVARGFSNAGVIRSFGISVEGDEDPFYNFLNDPKNPEKKLLAAIKLGDALYNAIAYLSDYDPSGNFDQYFMDMGLIGQEYCEAITQFAQFAPKEARPNADELIGFKEASTSILAMLRVQIGGLTIELEAKVTTPSGPVLPQSPGDYRVLGQYFDPDPFRQLCYDFLSPLSRSLNLFSIDDQIRHVQEDQKESLARRALERRPDIIWYSQMKAALERATNQNPDNIRTIAEDIGISVGSIGFSTYSSASRDLMTYALNHHKWETLTAYLRTKRFL